MMYGKIMLNDDFLKKISEENSKENSTDKKPYFLLNQEEIDKLLGYKKAYEVIMQKIETI